MIIFNLLFSENYGLFHLFLPPYLLWIFFIVGKYSTLPRSLTKINLTKMLITLLLLLRCATLWGRDLILRLINHPNKKGLFLTATDPSSSFHTILQNAFYAHLIGYLWNIFLSPFAHVALTLLFQLLSSFWLSQTPQGPSPLCGFPTPLLL